MKKYVVIFLCLAMLIAACVPAYAVSRDTSYEESLARNLESLSRETAMEEFCFLALRTTEGIGKRSFRDKFRCTLDSVYSSAIEKMKRQKLLEETEHHVRLTQLGMKFGNVVFREFII